MSIPTGTHRQVTKVTINAPIVSFRYPHFLVGMQPTYDVPPPSTIFGHIASALGYWPEQKIRFAYAFSSRSKSTDYEHQWIFKKKEQKRGVKYELNMNPSRREFLFDVELDLYLDPVELGDAFRSPAFTVVLGRSQDLACIRKVDVITLEFASDGYIENTILPLDFRKRLPWGVTVLMPKFIGQMPKREPVFAPYIVVRDRVYVGNAGSTASRRMIEIKEDPISGWWLDPDTPEDSGGKRLLWFHEMTPGGR